MSLGEIKDTTDNLAHIVDVVRDDVGRAIVASRVAPTVRALGELAVGNFNFGLSILAGISGVLMMISIMYLIITVYDRSLACSTIVYYNIGVFCISVMMGAAALLVLGAGYGVINIIDDASFKVLNGY